MTFDEKEKVFAIGTQIKYWQHSDWNDADICE